MRREEGAGAGGRDRGAGLLGLAPPHAEHIILPLGVERALTTFAWLFAPGVHADEIDDTVAFSDQGHHEGLVICDAARAACSRPAAAAAGLWSSAKTAATFMGSWRTGFGKPGSRQGLAASQGCGLIA